MDDKQQEIQIPKVHYEGKDNQLLERVSKFKAGSLRIIVFTIVGMILGWLSFNYYTDTFIVTKVILAIPYKISEAIYTSIIGTGGGFFSAGMLSDYNAFFRQSELATLLAERITPVLIGGALYGSLGYFTGDKHVFTLSRFVKFTGVWCVIILVYIGGVYGVNAKAVSDNDNMKNISWFFLCTPSQGETIWDERLPVLLDAFADGLERDRIMERDMDAEHELMILYDHGLRSMVAYVNWDRNYLVTENHTTYRISEEFAGYVKEYYETGQLMGIRNIHPMSEGDEE